MSSILITAPGECIDTSVGAEQAPTVNPDSVCGRAELPLDQPIVNEEGE